MPKTRQSLKGYRFGKRVVLGDSFYCVRKDDKCKRGYMKYLCVVVKCECGNTSIVRVSTLTSGEGRSCQHCLNVTHGHTQYKARPRSYRTWTNIRQRVFNRNNRNPAYINVDIDPKWDDSFETFYEDMGDPPTPAHSIDRIDNARGYWPDNCRWATRGEQNRNQRSNKMLTHDGRTLCIAEWSEITGLRYNTLYNRVCNLGWDHEDAITTPCGQVPTHKLSKDIHECH